MNAARFEAKINRSGDCWLWTGAVQSSGYGSFGHGGRTYLAHRVSYELHVGPIADGLTIDHLCRQRLCVRPDHLEPVALAENVRRGGRALRTECPSGHLFAGDNLIVKARADGRTERRCRACQYRMQRASRLRSQLRQAEPAT